MKISYEYQSTLMDLRVVDIGQLYVIDPVFSIDYGWLGTIFLSHHFLVVKQFLI